MYVYCNFYCSPAKKSPHFFGLATPLAEALVINKSEKYHNLEQHYTYCPVASETMGLIDEEIF